jgi:hypothetical protein
MVTAWITKKGPVSYEKLGDQQANGVLALLYKTEAIKQQIPFQLAFEVQYCFGASWV